MIIGLTLNRLIQRARARYRLARRVLRKAKQRLYFRVVLFLYASWRQIVYLLLRAFRRVSIFHATITGLAIAVSFAAYLPNALLYGPTLTVSGVHLASAGIIGTALALVLTLSIVPAQKAADVFSSAIVKLYARDRQLLFVFASLSVLALISVLFGTGWTFGLSARYTLAAQFVVLGAAFDVLRAFYSRTLDLLIPATALSLVEKECTYYIAAMKREIERLVRINRLSGEKIGNGSDLIPRWLFYSRSPAPNQLTAWTDQLEEFALKAIARRDTQAAKASVQTIASIGMTYADSRRDSLVLLPDHSAPLSVAVSDIGNVLNPIYDSLKNICEDAARQPNEAVAMGCLRAIGDMAVHAMTIIHDQEGQPKTAPLAYTPVFYLDALAKVATKAEMNDALLTTIRATGGVFGKISGTVYTREVESTALDCLFHIAATSYARQAVVPCFRAVEMMLHAAEHELQMRGFQPVSILSTVLQYLTELVPLEAKMDKLGQRSLQTFPPYSLSFSANIPALLAEVANQVKPVDPKRPWVDPFHDFAEASQKIVYHYRDVAKKVTFDGVLLQKWIVDSIITLAEVHLHLLESPPAGSERFLETVDNRLKWFVYTPQMFFLETTSFPSYHAYEAAGRLAILGMRLLRIDRTETAEACGKAVARIGAKSAAAEGSNPYDTANILISLEQLARAADAFGCTSLAKRFRVLGNSEEFSEENLPGYTDAIRTRLQQLEDGLGKGDRHISLPHDPLPLLRQILRDRRSPSARK